MVTLSQLRRSTAERLSGECGECAAFDSDLLIEKALMLERGRFPLLADRPVDPDPVEPLIERRLSGEPTQYILGEWEFYGLRFEVGEGVLIPRADTETAVEQALAALSGKTNPRVLDLCAGSGCISIALKVNRPDAAVTAVELYPPAIDYLRRNCSLNRVGIDVRQFDVMMEPVGFEGYDLIVSNPPYIDSRAMDSLPENVKREPRTALFGGADGLDFYRAIADKWLPLMKKDGAVVLEIGFDQGEKVQNLLRSKGMNTSLVKDLSGNDRVIIGTLSKL